ncbi:MAG: carboxypeptidase-like regulatory domain-containing protein [Pirellulales bacterium]
MSFQKIRMFLCCVLLVCLSGLPGCGNSGPVLVSVEGTVTLDGKPIGGASVLFQPPAGGRPAVAQTDSQGQFKLAKETGAHVGINRVAITKEISPEKPVSNEEDEEGSSDFELATPAKYASPQLSGLTVDVQPGMKPVSLEMSSD